VYTVRKRIVPVYSFPVCQLLDRFGVQQLGNHNVVLLPQASARGQHETNQSKSMLIRFSY